jgi:UPF0755 protein
LNSPFRPPSDSVPEPAPLPEATPDERPGDASAAPVSTTPAARPSGSRRPTPATAFAGPAACDPDFYADPTPLPGHDSVLTSELRPHPGEGYGAGARTPPLGGRAVPGAGEPYPPMAGHPNGLGASMDQKRITPRSPRAALEPEHVPMPTPPSKRARHPLVIIGNLIFTFIVLVAISVGVVVMIGKQRFDVPGPLQREKIVNIPKNSGMRDIADLLQREGVIDQPWLFVGGVLVMKAREELKAGEYQFQKQATLRDVVETIIEGKVVQHLFTVPEGLTSEQIVQRLLDTEALSGNIKEIPREGTLLPDSYKFTRGIAREAMIQRMQQAQRQALQQAWERRMPDIPVKTPEQLLILASIVEKETGKADERTRVAAVFANRLKQRMKLQSDPTIIYGLVGGKGTLGRPILRSEIDQATPYNTYAIDGLPPGPIANPGRASLEATANPARTKELYFVADGTGGHAFSDTYEQHQRNVARLRALERQAKDAAPLDAVAPPPKEPVAEAPAAEKPAAQPAQQQRRRGASAPPPRNNRQQ